MTHLTPITKCMAHLPLAFHHGRPGSALVICFGMGTSYRSALCWDVKTTAVELVPGVKDAFGYYFPDAQRWLDQPKGRIVVDDGRRYLQRNTNKYDVILIDPPPPVEAAGSSLLYSGEFYELAKQRLKRGGILQAWFPFGPNITCSAIAQSINNAFPHVRVLPSIEGWGLHFLASMEPIDGLDVESLLGRMPERAKADLLEWNPRANLRGGLAFVLAGELPIEVLLPADPRVHITDDRPFNEYFLLRSWGLYSPGR
jgi:spermidine synthase